MDRLIDTLEGAVCAKCYNPPGACRCPIERPLGLTEKQRQEIFRANVNAAHQTGRVINPIDQHAPGAKLDQGKIQAGILLQFGRALEAIAEVCTYGAGKYSRGGWQHVENGAERYTDAMMRHLLAEERSAEDEESGLAHAAHAAWNALARLEFMRKEGEDG